MPVISVGDAAQQFISMRNGGTIKTELSRLAQSLSSGLVTDVTRELDGQTTRFSGINYTLSQLDGYDQAATEAGQTAAGIQLVLNKLDVSRNETSNQLLLLTDASSTPQIDEASTAARSTFETMVSALNTRVADRALMGGVDVESAPLAGAEDMLADLQLAIGGATTQAAITGAVTAWFDDPAGGFAMMGYQGDTGPVATKRITDDKTYQIDARADDPAIKEVLKSAALAAIADDLPALDRETKLGLLQDAATGLFAASSGLVAVQARIGFVEAGIEQTSVEISAQRTALSISKNDLIAVDQFDTASRLQSVQLQLETHYTVTARMSQLSLLRYI